MVESVISDKNDDCSNNPASIDQKITTQFNEVLYAAAMMYSNRGMW